MALLNSITMDYSQYYDDTKPQCQTCLYCVYEMTLRSLMCQQDRHPITEREKWKPRDCDNYVKG